MKQLVMMLSVLLSLPTLADVAPDKRLLCSQNSLYEGKAEFKHDCQALLANKQCMLTDSWVNIRGQLAPFDGNIFWAKDKPACILSHHTPADRPQLGEVATLMPTLDLNGDFSSYIGKKIEIDGFVSFYTHTGVLSSGTYGDLHVRGITDLATGKRTEFNIPLRFIERTGKKTLEGTIVQHENRMVIEANDRYELIGDHTFEQYLGKTVQVEGFHVHSKYEELKAGTVTPFQPHTNKPKKIKPKPVSELFAVNTITTTKDGKTQILSSDTGPYVRYELAPNKYTYVNPKKLLQLSNCWAVGETKEVKGHFDVQLPNTVVFVLATPTCTVTQKNYPPRLIITPIKHYAVTKPTSEQAAQQLMVAAKAKQQTTIKATVKLLYAVHEYEDLGLEITP